MGQLMKDVLSCRRTEKQLRYEDIICENGAIKKMAGKIFLDKRRHAKHYYIAVGEIVMIRNYEAGKLESHFRLKSFKVIEDRLRYGCHVWSITRFV